MRKSFALSMTYQPIHADEKGVPMTWWSSISFVTVSVYFFLAIVLVMKAPQIMQWLGNQQDRVERAGLMMRRIKYRWLVPWVDRIPISADVWTGLRLVLIGSSLYLFQAWYPTTTVILVYSFGWLTDYLDGLKAEAEATRRHRPSLHGKYFDPIVDMLCFAAMALVLHRFYPNQVMLWFAGAIGARLVLFGLLLWQRRHYPTWRRRLSSSILPKSITGEVKAAIIAVSFGLVMVDPAKAATVLWAGRLLLLAVILEGLTLIHLVRTAIRHSRLKLIEPDTKYGNT